MQQLVTITSQGQITIPAKMRRQLGIKKSQQLRLNLEKDKIVVDKPLTILDLAGTYIPRKNKDKSVLEAREAFETQYSRV